MSAALSPSHDTSYQQLWEDMFPDAYNSASFNTLTGSWVLPESPELQLSNEPSYAAIASELGPRQPIENSRKTRFERKPVTAPSATSEVSWDMITSHHEQLVALHSHLSQLQGYVEALELKAKVGRDKKMSFSQYCRKQVKLISLFQDARRH